MEYGIGGSHSERTLETTGLADQLVEWLDIHAGTGAEAATEARADPSVSFGDWCCIPFVTLIVVGDMVLQFWGK